MVKRIRSSLKLKAALMVGAMLLAVSATVAFASWRVLERTWEDHRRREAESIVGGLMGLARRAVSTGEFSHLTQDLENIKINLPRVRYIALVDATGKALAHSDPARIGRVFDDPVGLAAARTTRPIFQVYSRDTGEKIYDFAVPVFLGNRAWGALRVGIPYDDIARERTVIFYDALSIGSVTLVIGALGARWMTARFMEPLERLEKATALVAAGDLSHHVPVVSSDEYGRLARSFNRMVDEVRKAVDETERRNLRLAEMSNEALEVLVSALSYRDHATEGHSRRVVAYTLATARVMGVPESELEDLRRGALLHDIGKIGIPDRILLKKGKLSDEERTVMMTHPALGCEIIADSEFLRGAMPVILHHHERYDGTGYPLGLAGASIPLGARIFAVADAYDSMTSTRPYHRAWPHHQALDEIVRCSGSQFDPAVVEAFLSVPESEILRIKLGVDGTVPARLA